MTGKGLFEPGHQYGSSFVKLSPKLEVLDWFTPANHVWLSFADVDLGSAGPLLLPGSNQLVGGGKQGKFYLLAGDKMGKLQPSGAVAPALQEFKVASHWTLTWLSWLIPVFGYHHIHGSPVYWKSARHGPLVYVWPEESPLKAFQYDPASHFKTKAFLTGSQAPKGMPGGFLSLSANLDQEGLLWRRLRSTRMLLSKPCAATSGYSTQTPSSPFGVPPRTSPKINSISPNTAHPRSPTARFTSPRFQIG